MTKFQSACLIDSVMAGEVTINNLGSQPYLSATFAFSNSETGQRLGQSKRNVWSEETMKKLSEFLAALEQEAGAELFVPSPTHSGVEESEPATDGVPGL